MLLCMSNRDTWIPIGRIAAAIAARLESRREQILERAIDAAPSEESAGSISALGASNEALEPIPAGRGDGEEEGRVCVEQDAASFPAGFQDAGVGGKGVAHYSTVVGRRAAAVGRRNSEAACRGGKPCGAANNVIEFAALGVAARESSRTLRPAHCSAPDFNSASAASNRRRQSASVLSRMSAEYRPCITVV